MHPEIKRLRNRSILLHLPFVFIAIAAIAIVLHAQLPLMFRLILLSPAFWIALQLFEVFTGIATQNAQERIRKASPAKDRAALDLVNGASRAIGLKRPVRLHFANDSRFGMASVSFSAHWIVSFDRIFWDFMNDDERETIVMHELFHVVCFHALLWAVLLVGFGSVTVLPMLPFLEHQATIFTTLATALSCAAVYGGWFLAMRALSWHSEYSADRASAILTRRSPTYVTNLYCAVESLPRELRIEKRPTVEAAQREGNLPFYPTRPQRTGWRRYYYELRAFCRSSHPHDADRHAAVAHLVCHD